MDESKVLISDNEYNIRKFLELTDLILKEIVKHLLSVSGLLTIQVL